MKNTLASIALFVFLTSTFSSDALALLPPVDDIRDNIKIVLPTATPTPIVFKKIEPIVTIKLIPTLGQKITVTPSPTPEAKSTVTSEPTLGIKMTETPDQEKMEEISPIVTATKTEEMMENKTDLKTWFMGITIGLLALIIIIQLFSKKKEEE